MLSGLAGVTLPNLARKKECARASSETKAIE